jgi:hypothetical protein
MQLASLHVQLLLKIREKNGEHLPSGERNASKFRASGQLILLHVSTANRTKKKQCQNSAS